MVTVTQNVVVNVSTNAQQFDQSVKQMGNRMAWFRSELLGTLFFGMAMQRLLSSFTRPSLEAAGVFKILGDTLKIFFIDAAIEAQGAALELSKVLLDFQSDHPEIAKAIGLTTFAAEELGGGLSLVSQAMLGIASLKFAFPNAWEAVAKGVGKLSTAIGFKGVGLVGAFGFLALVFAGREGVTFLIEDLGKKVGLSSDLIDTLFDLLDAPINPVNFWSGILDTLTSITDLFIPGSTLDKLLNKLGGTSLLPARQQPGLASSIDDRLFTPIEENNLQSTEGGLMTPSFGNLSPGMINIENINVTVNASSGFGSAGDSDFIAPGTSSSEIGNLIGEGVKDALNQSISDR